MKKLLITLSLFASMFSATQTRAFVGLVSDSDALMLVGWSFIIISDSTTTTVRRRTIHRRGRTRRIVYRTTRYVFYPVIALAGLVLLNEDGVSAGVSSQIPQETADRFGLNAKEKMAIEENADEINAINSTIFEETSNLANFDERAVEAGKLWNEYGEQLPTEALVGLRKIADYEEK